MEPPPRELRIFLRVSKIFRETVYWVDPIMYSFTELEQMAKWCYDTFGCPGTNIATMNFVWQYQAMPDYVFWFKEEKNAMLFVLRWV